MNKRLFLILPLLVSSMSNLFAQFDVMTTEQAKKELTENLSLTSAEVDQTYSKHQIPCSNEILQNGANCFNNHYNLYRLNDIIGIKFFLCPSKNNTESKSFYLNGIANSIGVPCVNHADSTLSFRTLEAGYYIVTQKILFTEQIQRKKNELMEHYKLSSTEISMKALAPGSVNDISVDTKLHDSTLVRAFFDHSITSSISKKEYYTKRILKNESIYEDNIPILVLTDSEGKDYYVSEYGSFSVSTEVEYIDRYSVYNDKTRRSSVNIIICPTTLRDMLIYASSYLEKLETSLKNQECYLSYQDNTYDDPISGDTKPAPDKSILYKCERLIMMDGKIYGIYSNESGSYSIELGPIRSYIINNKGESCLGNSGSYYSYSDNGIVVQDKDMVIRTYDDNVIYVCDGCIDGKMRITPMSFLERKQQLENEVKTVLEKAEEKRRIEYEQSRKEYEQRIEQERKANIEKYGSEFGGNINNRKVALGMTKEMCQKSWGYPSERYSKVNSNGTLEIWVYYSAMLSFSNGKLVQIDKW